MGVESKILYEDIDIDAELQTQGRGMKRRHAIPKVYEAQRIQDADRGRVAGNSRYGAGPER